MFCAQEVCIEVYRQGLAPQVEIKVIDQRAWVNACIVHDDIGAAERSVNFLGDVRPAFVASDVGSDRNCGSTEPGRSFFGLIEINQHERSTARGQLYGDSLTNPSCGTGNDRDPPCMASRFYHR